MQHRFNSNNDNKALHAFILNHENDDERKLVLKHATIHGVPSSVVAQQLSGRRKAKTKLPSFYQHVEIFYPPSINLEQSSSELTARFKATIVADAIAGSSTEVKSGVDLTGGFGIDAYFLRTACDDLHFVEADAGLVEIAEHNHRVLGATDIRYHATTAESFVHSCNRKFNFAFIDPSRRKNSKKVFQLADGQPDAGLLLPALLSIADKVLIKASPLLDLQQGLAELKKVDSIFVVAVDDECKEVLFLCSALGTSSPPITAINFSSRVQADTSGAEPFRFTLAEEKNAPSRFADPLTYLYEPYSWILKSGGFKTVGHRYGLFKLQVNTHLYTSDQVVKDFPGRIFKIEDGKPKPRSWKANVLVRNYPLSVEELKKKWQIKDGGDNYLIAFSGQTQKFLVAASRLK